VVRLAAGALNPTYTYGKRGSSGGGSGEAWAPHAPANSGVRHACNLSALRLFWEVPSAFLPDFDACVPCPMHLLCRLACAQERWCESLTLRLGADAGNLACSARVAGVRRGLCRRVRGRPGLPAARAPRDVPGGAAAAAAAREAPGVRASWEAAGPITPVVAACKCTALVVAAPRHAAFARHSEPSAAFADA